MDDLSRKRLERQLKRKLSPEEITGSLLQAGLFLVAYELLKIEIVDNTKSFFVDGFEYSADVLALDPSPFRASCLWLARMEAFTDGDVEVAMTIREHRHKVAHELPGILIDPDACIDLGLVAEANRLITAAGRFWGRVNVDTNPDFDGRDIKDEDISSGGMLLMNHILTIITRHDT